MKLLLDTNFLIDCIRFKIDVFQELGKLEEEEGNIDIFIPLFCLQEIEKIAKRKKGNARIALEILRDPKISVLNIKKTGSVDRCLLEYAKSHSFAVATNDNELIEKLRKSRVNVIRIRQRKFFEIV